MRGETDTKLTVGGTTLTRPDLVTEPAAAAIVVVALVETAGEVIVKAALLFPAGTVTLAGTVATPPLAVSAMTRPPLAADPSSKTVPDDFVPPTTDDGRLTIESDAGFNVSRNDFAIPPSAAVIVTWRATLTP